MNISTNKLVSAAVKNADILSLFVSILERNPGNDPIGYYLNPSATSGPIYYLQEALSNMNILKYRLFEAPHLYSMLVRLGLLAYVGGEMGFISKKWATAGKKAAIGAGIAALTLPGSGPAPTNTSYMTAPTQGDYGY